MKFRLVLSAISLLSLAACGSFATNTNAGGALNVAGSTAQDAGGVQLVDTAPQTATIVSGIDCKNKVWNATPTNARAIEVMKAQAKQAGYSKVVLKSVAPVPGALMLNCWSAIEAKGLAY